LTSSTDVTWVGGITECRRIVALAAAYDIPIVPHGAIFLSACEIIDCIPM